MCVGIELETKIPTFRWIKAEPPALSTAIPYGIRRIHMIMHEMKWDINMVPVDIGIGFIYSTATATATATDGTVQYMYN